MGGERGGAVGEQNVKYVFHEKISHTGDTKFLYILRRVAPTQTIPKHPPHKKKYVSCVMCHVLPVTCHMSLMPTATAMDPPPANSPTMQDDATDLDLHTSIMSCSDFDHFLSQPK